MRLALRLAALTIEFIERRKVSFEKAFNIACEKVKVRDVKREAYQLAWSTLLKYKVADKVLAENKLANVPLRRKCAFRVAFYLMLYRRLGYEVIKRASGGLLTGRLLQVLRSISNLEENDILEGLKPLEFLSVKYSYPYWLIQELSSFMSIKELEKLLKASERKSIWLRVVPRHFTTADLLKELKKDSVKAVIDNDYPDLLVRILDVDKPVSELKVIKKGVAVVQDKASVAVALLVQGAPGEVIWDACAAPGLKTSIIAACNPRTVVVGGDISVNRVFEAKRLLIRKFGTDHIDLVVADARTPYMRKANIVLLDAPCTNSGAIRNDPALRIILEDRTLVEKYSSLQYKLLKSVMNIKACRSIVYCTCSLLPHEGEKVLQKVLNEQEKWYVADVKIPAEEGYSLGIKGVKRFFPHKNGTIGFFVAVLNR